jgi:hypothetical protein
LHDYILNKNTISNYSESLLDVFNKYSRLSLICSFEDTYGKKLIAKNINKAYTSNLLNMKFISVFNQFDAFVKYNQEIIRNYSIYFVEKVGDMTKDLIMLDKKFNLISEYSLYRSKLNVKILAVCHPSKLIKNTSMELIQRIYNSNLKVEHKKFIVNKIIELTDKKYNIAQISKILRKNHSSE